MVIVAVEMLAGGGKGIGSYVWEQYNALKLPEMVAAIIIIGVVGFLLDRLPALGTRRRDRGGAAMSLVVERSRRRSATAARSRPCCAAVDLEVRPGELVALIGHSGWASRRWSAPSVGCS